MLLVFAINCTRHGVVRVTFDVSFAKTPKHPNHQNWFDLLDALAMSTGAPSARGRRRRRRNKPSSSEDSSVAAPSPTAQLVASIRHDDLAAFSALLQSNPELDVNRRSPQGDAPLVEACRFGRLGMTSELLATRLASVNVASSNRAANRVGLTPLIAACMTLQPELVAMLLAKSQKKVNLLKTFGRVNALTVCLLFTVANGRTDEQNDVALQILLQLLQYAKQQGQLTQVLAAKPDKVHSLVHVAAGLANWKALRMLREHAGELDVDFSARNGVDHSALHVVEMNAFQARSLLFCEPPRPEVVGGRKGKGRGQNSRKKKAIEGDEKVEHEEKETMTLEERSEAGTLVGGFVVEAEAVIDNCFFFRVRQANIYQIAAGSRDGSFPRDADSDGTV
jgi:hypothetical protein